MTKYNFEMPNNILNIDINRLTNQLWKLIPMRENEENWKNQLDTVVLEITGLNEVLCNKSEFLILLSKLEGLKTKDIGFTLYRKTVFESISLLREVLKDE